MEQEMADAAASATSRRHQQRGRLAFVAALLVAITGVVAALLVDTGSRDPVGQLDAAVAYADAHRTAGFTIDVEQRFENGEGGLGQSGTARARVEGVLRLPDSFRAVSRDGQSISESIRLPDGSFDRYADGDDLDGEKWSYTSAEDSAELRDHAFTADDAETMSESMVSGLSTVGGIGGIGGASAVLSTLGAPQELLDALRKVDRVERVDADTVRAALDPDDLLPDGMADELRKHVQLGVDVEVTSGAGDRLDEIVFTERAEPLASTAGDHGDDDFGMMTGRTTTTMTMRFHDWGRPVTIEAPAGVDIDPTPSIDEEGLTAVTAYPLFTVGSLPPGWVLTGATHEEGSADDETCDSVSLSYADPDAEPTTGAGGDEVFPPDLTVDVSDAACQWQDTPDGEAVVAGGRAAVVSEADDDLDPDSYTTVTVTIDGARVEVSSDLPRDEVLRLVASLEPFDLASQPIRQQVPPS